MAFSPLKYTDPLNSPEYQAFVASMAVHCHCEHPYPCPCDGVLAGGLCDGMKPDRDWDWHDPDTEEDY